MHKKAFKIAMVMFLAGATQDFAQADILTDARVCIANADNQKQFFSVAGKTKSAYPGELVCFNQKVDYGPNGKYRLDIKGPSGSGISYELYSVADDRITQYWSDYNARALNAGLNFVSGTVIPGLSGLQYFNKFLRAFGVDTPPDKFDFSGDAPPPKSLISYVPTSSSGPLFALYPYSEVKKQPWGDEQFSWDKPTREERYSCGKLSKCKTKYQIRYTGSKSGQIMTMHQYREYYESWANYGRPQLKKDYVNYGSDAVYLCYNPHGDSGWSSCSAASNSKPIDYDEAGSNGGGEVVIYNNSAVPASYLLKFTDGRSVGTGPIAAGDKYVISKAAMNTEEGQFEIGYTTKADGQVGICLFGQPYASNQADLHITFNYDFSAPPSYFGPYSCKVKGAGQPDQLRIPVYKKVEAAKCPSTKNSGPEVLGYYPNYAATNGYQAFEIPCSVDTILYSFLQIGDCKAPKQGENVNVDECVENTNENGVVVNKGVQDYKIHSTDPWADYATASKGGGHGNVATALATGKKVLPSIAGWSLSAPLGEAIKSKHRKEFIQSIIDWMVDAQNEAALFGVTNKFSGVDIDWEPNENMWTAPKGDRTKYSLTKDDLINFKDFMKELKEALSYAKANGKLKDNILTMAMTSNPVAIKHVDKTYGGKYWKSLIEESGVNHIGLMTYDYFAPSWYEDVKNANFNAPIYLDKKSKHIPEAFTKPPYSGYNINASVDAFVNHSGVPANKVVIGAGAYGRMYAINFDGNYNNPYQIEDKDKFMEGPRSTMEGPRNPGSKDNSLFTVEIETSKNQMGTWINYFFPWEGRKVDEGVGSAYAIGHLNVDNSQKVLVTYDNYNSAAQKMSFAKSKGLYGVMLWDLTGDYKRVKVPHDALSVLDGLMEGKK